MDSGTSTDVLKAAVVKSAVVTVAVVLGLAVA